MKIKQKLLGSFVWQPFTQGFMKPPVSFFGKGDDEMRMAYIDRALNYIPLVNRASIVAVRTMIGKHEAARHAAR